MAAKRATRKASGRKKSTRKAAGRKKTARKKTAGRKKAVRKTASRKKAGGRKKAGARKKVARKKRRFARSAQARRETVGCSQERWLARPQAEAQAAEVSGRREDPRGACEARGDHRVPRSDRTGFRRDPNDRAADFRRTAQGVGRDHRHPPVLDRHRPDLGRDFARVSNRAMDELIVVALAAGSDRVRLPDADRFGVRVRR